MATTLGQVSVTLLLQAGQFLSGTKAAGTQLSALEKQGTMSSAKLSSSMSSLFKNVGGGLIAFGLLKKGLVDSIGKFYEAKDSSDKLTAALGGNIEKAKQFEEISARLQQQTIFGDELINDNFTFLAGQERTEEQMKKVMSAAVDYASFMKKDLSTAVKELSMTYEGNIGKLGRIDGRLKELTPEQLRNGAAVDLLAEKYNGWGEIVGNTMTGKIERFKNALDELQEGIGEGFMSGFAEELDSVSNSMLGVSVEAKDLGVFLGKTLSYALELVTGFKLLKGVFDITQNSLFKLKVVFRDLTGTVGSFAIKLLDLPSKLPVVGNFFDELKFYAEKYKNKLLEVIGVQNALVEGKAKFDQKQYDETYIGNAKDPMKDPANDGSKRSSPTKNSGNVSKLQEEKVELDEIEQLREDINKLEAEHKKSVEKHGPAINKYLQGQIDKIRELKAQLKDLLSVEEQRARDYIDRADKTKETAKGSSPGSTSATAQPDVMGSDEDWLKRIGYATAIFNILNKRPDNPFQVFLMILGIAQQIALLMNAGPAGGLLGALGGLFGAFGGIFGFKSGGQLSEGKIKGPGSSTSDSILALSGSRLIRLSNQEYIVPAWMNFLYPMLDEIRTRGVSTRNSFASGGRLNQSPSMNPVFNGSITIYEDSIVSETFARRIVSTGMPGYNIIKKQRGSRT